MGYSARYHAASLAAVFLALAIGILIGVGLGNKIVRSTTRGLEHSLKSDLADTRSRNETLQAQLNQERDFSEQTYPALVGNLLSGQRIAVVALGGLPDSMNGDISSVVGAESNYGIKSTADRLLPELVQPAAPPGLSPGSR